MKTALVSCLSLLVLSPYVQAQTVIPFSSDRWQFSANEAIQAPKEQIVEEYLGKPCVRLKNSGAELKDVRFTNGIIEFDMALPPGRGFSGILFRRQDDKNYENIYVRPHQSGNPDALQYQPIFQGKESWQLYHGEGYSAAVNYTFDQWMHVKLVIAGSQMEVYMGDMDKPAMVAFELKRPVQPGTLGLSSFGMSHCRFANFTYTSVDKPALKSVLKPKSPTPNGTIMQWQVSQAFPEKRLDKVLQLTANQKNGLIWKPMAVEASGLSNIATGPTWSEASNTAFARLVIDSDREQIKPLQLGFSDRARVYLNDKLLFSGSDVFLSRDYRFLGTIGYYDEVYLPLKKGRNELWVAVSEEFGGWGIKGIIADQTGLTIQPVAN